MLRRALWLVALAVVVAGGIRLGMNVASDDVPDEGSVEVGFARDMRTHHEQAVEMAELLRERTRNQDLRLLAADIALTQQAQIGQMRGWLDVWDVTPTSTDPPMAWAPGHGGTDGDEMPGMASEEDVSRLEASSGDEAEVLFLQLMIRHHEGGVHMALLAAPLVDEPNVQAMARNVAETQLAEIGYLEALLTARHAEPLPSILPADAAELTARLGTHDEDQAQDLLDLLGRWWLVGLGAVVLLVLIRDLLRRPRAKRSSPTPPAIAAGETEVATVAEASDDQPDRASERATERGDDRAERLGDLDLDRIPVDDSSFDDV